MNRELPILFNTEMTTAILNGDKTVTRRPFGYKPLPKPGDFLWVREKWTYGELVFDSEDPWSPLYVIDITNLPVGAPGGAVYHYAYSGKKNPPFKNYGYGFLSENESADITSVKWKPSIHMPRKYARLFLMVDSVTTGRPCDITEDEALEEGFDPYCGVSARDFFLSTWESIYGRDLSIPCHIIQFHRVPGIYPAIPFLEVKP